MWPNITIYTPEQVESMLQIPRGRLAIWRRRSFGPHFVQLGRGVIRYRPRDIEAFLANNVYCPSSRWQYVDPPQTRPDVPPWDAPPMQ